MTLPTLIMENSVRDQALKCPRCDSFNTKFCYYNNYNLSQPRHFCKACKRYWTRGGTLRNIPVGGGCRKNKRMAKKSINLPCPVAKNTSTTVLSNSNPLFYNLPEFSSIHDFSLQFPLFDANFSDPIMNNLSNPCSSDLQSQIHLQKEDPGSSSILNSFALSNPQKKLGFDLKNNPSICDSDVFFPFRDNDIVGGNLTFLKDMKNEDYPFENLISNSSLYLNGTWPDVSICESASVSPLI